MGFLSNLANEGLYCALVDAHYDKVAANICKGNGLGSLDVTIDLDSMTDEEYERDDTEEKLNDVTKPTGIIPEFKGVSLLSKCAQDVKREREEKSNPQLSFNGVDVKFGKQDIIRNIAAAVNHFGFETEDDILRIRTRIAANLYLAGFADADTIFEALNKDSVVYATVNEHVRMYRGTPMDEKLIPIDIGKGIDDTVREKLKMLTDWELEYLTEHADASVLSDKIGDACKDITNCY